MLIFKCCITNLDLILALNDQVFPPPQRTAAGGVEELYLVLEPGKENRLITHDELNEIRKTRPPVAKTTRQFYYGS